MSDDTAAEVLQGMNIDVAVDLMGYTKHARTGILARRVAPVQINYLGYPGTMGIPYIDYIIADPYVIPDRLRACYSEQVVYMPECFQPNDDRRPVDPIPPRREAGFRKLLSSFAALMDSGNSLRKYLTHG